MQMAVPASSPSVLILDLDTGNIASKLLRELGGINAIGPILVGMAASIPVLQREWAADDIALRAVMAAVDAQDRRRSPLPANPLAFTP